VRVDLELLGAWAAIWIYACCILTFSSRLLGQPELGRWFGVPLLLAAVPLIYLLFTAPLFGRPALYYVQIGLMLAFLLVELVLDYIYRFPFRQVRWMVVSYVTLFFAGIGGMLGVAALAGHAWSITAIILFFVTGALAFIQRRVTGM